MALVRPHSAGLTVPMAALGYTITHESLFAIQSLFWIVYAVSWGVVGNIQNAVTDYEVDKKDPYKKHFPLVSGAIQIKTARRISTITLFGIGIWGIIGVGFDPAYSLLVVFGIAAGMSYNWTSKTFGASALMAGLAFPVPFLLAAGEVNNRVVLVYAFFVIQFMLQNGIGGGYKDLESDQSNMVKALGGRIADGFIVGTGNIIIFTVILRVVMMIAAITAVESYRDINWLYLIPYAILMFLTIKQSQYQKYDKKKQTLYTVLIEMASYYFLITTLSIIFAIDELLFLLFAPPALFILINRITWGSAITPKT